MAGYSATIAAVIVLLGASVACVAASAAQTPVYHGLSEFAPQVTRAVRHRVAVPEHRVELNYNVEHDSSYGDFLVLSNDARVVS